MAIIAKFIIRNIYEKKFRTFLIVFSIMISSALFFASSAISDTMVQMYLERLKQYFGDSTIIVNAGEKSPSPFFTLAGTKQTEDRLEYTIGAVQGSALHENSKGEIMNFSVLGINYRDIQQMNPFTLQEQNDLEPFEGNKVILGQGAADKLGLAAGGRLELEIAGHRYKFVIAGISRPSGPFVDESQTGYAVVPRDTLEKVYGARGKVNIAYLKPKTADEKQALIKELSSVYDRYVVKEPFSKEDLQYQLGTMNTSFMLMTVIVFCMSLFIIYSSFKVLTMERLPVIGTFRSIGATRKTTDVVLLAESFLYGTIGGILGCGLGVVILYLMSFMSRPVWMTGFKATLQFTPLQMLFAFLMAILLSMVSSILPILQVSKLPVKDVVLNMVEKKVSRKTVNLFLGLASITVALLLPRFTPNSIAMPVDIACMLLSIWAVILLVPFITNTFVRLFERLYTLLFGNEGVLAVKNLRNNKSIFNNIALLSIGISSLLMINTISHSVGIEVLNAYKDMTYDIQAEFPMADRNLENRLKSIDGVTATYGDYSSMNVKIADSHQTIMMLQGVNINKYRDYWNLDILGDAPQLLKELDASRNILVTLAVKDRLGVDIGDSLTLRTARGDRSYKVIGFISALMYNGSYAIVSEKYLKVDMERPFYSSIYIKTQKDPVQVEQAIKKSFQRSSFWSMTVDRMEETNMQSNAQMFAILNGFSILALIIGIFGVFNNLIISFIERRRSLAVLKSVGMNKVQILKMILVEALTGGIIGGSFGLFTGLLLIVNVGYVLKAMSLPMTMHYSLSQFLNSMLGGIIITLVASVSPALRSSRLNVIQAIKYE